MRVWIQRGHCFRRSGSTGTSGSGTTEQAYVNDIANRAVVLLQQAGHQAVAALADTYPASGYDVFIALHCDGSTSRSASGASIGYRTTNGRKAGEIWKRRYAARGWPHGFRSNNYTAALGSYYGTGWAASAGIPYAFILEHGFLTNPTQDGRFLTSTRGRTAAAYAIADTVEILSGDRPVNDTDTDAPQEDDVSLPKLNDTGADVVELQQGLWDWAHDPDLGGWSQWLRNTGMEGKTRDGENGWCDGIFGNQTRDAVIYFQRQNWIKDTGVVTVQTIARLEAKRYLTPLVRRIADLEAKLQGAQ